MAFTVVANVAAVTQLIGQATGLISSIIRAVATARQNRRECENLALRLSIIGDVLPRLPRDPVVERPLKELRTALGKAHELVLACQDRSAANRFFGARRHADSFREINARIYFVLSLFPMVNYAAITSHLARISLEHTWVPTMITVPSPGSPSLQTLTVVPDYPCMFSWAEIVTATNNFADKLSRGWSGTVYKGRLHDGPEVAVKVLDKHKPHDTFVPELVITFRLRHDHIVRLVGWCEEEDDRMFVYEHMSNGTLRDRLQHPGGGSSSSAATAPWMTRVAVLLGTSRAIHYLHCGAQPVVIHRNVSSSNILLDMNWTPRLSGFGSAVYQAAGQERGGQLVEEVVGTPGYIDPEYSRTKRVSTASDVYSFGVVMLEALTGEDPATLQLDSIRTGKLALKDVLDRRPSLDPTLPQMEALEIVADTAKRCLCLSRMGRPDMSKVVANLEEALVVIRSHEPMSMARLSLIRRRTSEN
ncbi:probable serine/threonine-protein kinase PBL21 [Aegilops tauschii subsp. strangulata]|uniref:Protein kinase domain-containing protein n=2 Tax=Aegilops tauschii TaxID=37682 RepID=A0A453DNZ8_AEGTS|nr:putative serine/threonine-protein kinase-like protein CCR3 [Aegilops tauschii subsp. strangulata]